MKAEERVRALHRPHTKQNGEVVCFQYRNGMDEPWPCDTIQALDEAKQQIAQRHSWWLDSNKMRADMEMRALMAELERDAQTALVERLRSALQAVVDNGWTDWVDRRSYIAVKEALALTTEAASAELEAKQS